MIKDKPVATLGAAGTVATALVAYAVSKGWVPGELAAVADATLGAVIFTAVHALVSPASKVREVLERDGTLTDADFGRLEAVITESLQGLDSA